MRRLRAWTAAVCILTLAPGLACADPLQRPSELIEMAHAFVEVGCAKEDNQKLRRAIALYEEAKALLVAPTLDPATLSEGARARRLEYLETIESRVKVCKAFLGGARPPGQTPPPKQAPEPEALPDAPKTPDATPLPPFQEGQRVEPWITAAMQRYHGEKDPTIRAAYAQRIAQIAGFHAIPALCRVFESESSRVAQQGIHEALADIGTRRVAARMKAYARKKYEDHWWNALDVIYRCLEKPEKVEPERPFLAAIRAFHQLKVRKLTLRIVRDLDDMGHEGIAALGEVVYVKDIGYHDVVIRMLATKKDRRAVPPLVHKMNRFKFHHRVQMPAHKALLQLGWYAVPELVNRLDNKAAGIWISWTLRKITGETMGTDKRKWHDWWKNEKVRHPELFDDPDERPPEVTPR